MENMLLKYSLFFFFFTLFLKISFSENPGQRTKSMQELSLKACVDSQNPVSLGTLSELQFTAWSPLGTILIDLLGSFIERKLWKK